MPVSLDLDDELSAADGKACDSSFPGRSRSVREPGTFGVLAECETSRALRGAFSRSGKQTIMEDWVNSAIGEGDRSHCFGRTAVNRAKRHLNVVHVEDDRLPYDGELRLVNGWLIALIGTNQPWRRETFTIAHELGHAALYVLDAKIDQAAASAERFCDAFAAELLMPNPREPVARQAGLDDESGRGLMLVDVLCERWDWKATPGRPGKVVWGELRA